MSLTNADRTATARELAACAAAIGADTDEIAAALTQDRDRVTAAFAVTGSARPEDVWAVRDYLDRRARELGVPVEWTVLTADARSAAERWFGIGPA